MDTIIARVRAQAGFTLIELMVAIAVLAILIGVAAPGLRDTFQNVRMSGYVNDLASDLALARTEAVKRALPVKVCAANLAFTGCSGGSNWQQGWIVFVDANDDNVWSSGSATEPGLRIREPSTSVGMTVGLTGGPTSNIILPFRPTGVMSASAAGDAVFTICDGRAGVPHAGREIRVSPTGRAVTRRINGC